MQKPEVALKIETKLYRTFSYKQIFQSRPDNQT